MLQETTGYHPTSQRPGLAPGWVSCPRRGHSGHRLTLAAESCHLHPVVDAPSLVFPALNQSLPRGWPRSITPPGHPAATASFERQLQGGSDASEGSSQGHCCLDPKSVTAPEPQTPWREPFQSIPVPLRQDGYSRKEDLVCFTRDCTPLSYCQQCGSGTP